METAAHTPGPWRVAPGETPWTEGDAQTAIDHGEPFGDTLCLFPVMGGEPGDDWLIALMPYEGAAGAERIAELEANARLIAAAPAMLAALEAVSLWMLDNDDVGGGGCPFCGIHANEQSACDVDETNACARVRAALALARGEVVRP